MSHHRGPKTLTQDLVFHYDTGNVKSFAGEPTTNFVDTIANYHGGSISTSYANGQYQTSALVINGIDNGVPSRNYSRFTGTTSDNNSQTYWTISGPLVVNEANQTATFSVYLKGTGTCHLAIYYDGGGYLVGPDITLTSTWTKYSITKTFGTFTTYHWVAVRGIVTTTDVYISSAQWERKSHPTPFASGTRSNTQSLIDLSRNRTISVSGASFDSSGMIVFDGTDDAIPITTPPNFSGSGSWTMNTWFKINGAPSSTTYMNVIVDMDPTGGSANMICVNWSDMMLQYRSRPVGGSYTTINGSVLSQGVWYNATVVRYGTNETKMFLNGVQDGGTYSGNLPAGNQSFFNIGRWTDGTVYTNASIPIVSIYNRALTPDEVFRNYVSLKSRFENEIPRNGMMYHVDANNPNSYSGLGNTWYDISDNNYDFTLVNNPVYGTHNGLKTFTFSGTDDYAIRNGSISHDIGTQATIFVVMAGIDNSNFGSCSRLVSINDGSSNNVDYSNYFSLPSCNQDKFNLYYKVNPGGLNPTSSFIGSGDPYRVLAYSWTASNNARVYFNGNLEGYTSSVASAFDYTTVQRMTFAINAALTLENSYVRISEVIMYNRQMSDEEVSRTSSTLKNKYRI
jgi:hypothetical protein